MMARPTVCKLSNEKLKDYILNKLIDENGNRMSIRDLVVDEDFIKTTGFKPSKNMTMGTISYHLKRIGLTERVLYEYHIKTGRIPSHITFEDFEQHKAKKTKQLHRLLHQTEDVSERELMKWDKVAKKFGLVVTARSLGVRGFKEFCYACGITDEDIEVAYK